MARVADNTTASAAPSSPRSPDTTAVAQEAQKAQETLPVAKQSFGKGEGGPLRRGVKESWPPEVSILPNAPLGYVTIIRIHFGIRAQPYRTVDRRSGRVTLLASSLIPVYASTFVLRHHTMHHPPHRSVPPSPHKHPIGPNHIHCQVWILPNHPLQPHL